MEQNKFEPNEAIPPAETVKELLEVRMMTLEALAKNTELDAEVLLEVIEVKRPIDETIAAKFEEVFGIPKTFWLNLEKNYQTTLARMKKQQID